MVDMKKLEKQIKREVQEKISKMTDEEKEEMATNYPGHLCTRPHFAFHMYPNWKKPEYQDKTSKWAMDIKKYGYQLEMETPRFHDWLIAVTDNPDLDHARDVFIKMAKIWAEEVGIPDKHLMFYQKYRYENDPPRPKPKRRKK
jgi:hypothetical protein